jgi:hypothetical protein
LSPITVSAGAPAASEQFGGDVAFVAFGRGHRERAWGAIDGEQAVQAEAPDVAAVAAAVPVVGGVGELGPADGLDRAGALNWGAVDDQQIVLPARAVAGKLGDMSLIRAGADRVSMTACASARSCSCSLPGSRDGICRGSWAARRRRRIDACRNGSAQARGRRCIASCCAGSMLPDGSTGRRR